MAVTLAAFIGSFQQSADEWIEQAIPADLFVTSSAKLAGVQNQPMLAAVSDELATIPEIELIDPVRLLQHDALGLRIFVISLNTEIYASRGKPAGPRGHAADRSAARGELRGAQREPGPAPQPRRRAAPSP